VKILILRFSSIGDIVLTTPIIRCIQEQIPGVEIHFLCKEKFSSILRSNTRISKMYVFDKSTKEVLSDLKAEKYDYVIDLHNNIRTLFLKFKLGRKSFSFPKLNVKKWLLVQFKINKMPNKHVVERYFEAVEKLCVKNDLKAGEYFIEQENQIDVTKELGFTNFIAVALGAQFSTKRMPFDKLKDILERIDANIVFLGDKNDITFAEKLITKLSSKSIFNACGKFNLNQSASIVSQAKVLLTHDTGLMHIASCFGVQIVSVWGNTVPDLGMFPYMPDLKGHFSIHEVKGLSCRPCSKIGFQACPKEHFNCMNLQDSEKISEDIKNRFLFAQK
jgi:ADP-heptose:LPS heptosyltransferase